jgi:hypothetical protein
MLRKYYVHIHAYVSQAWNGRARQKQLVDIQETCGTTGMQLAVQKDRFSIFGLQRAHVIAVVKSDEPALVANASPSSCGEVRFSIDPIMRWKACRRRPAAGRIAQLSNSLPRRAVVTFLFERLGSLFCKIESLCCNLSFDAETLWLRFAHCRLCLFSLVS